MHYAFQVGNVLSIEKSKLDTACFQLQIGRLDEDEYDFLCEYYRVISLIAVALKTLEANKYTCGLYLPILFGLKIKLQAMAEDPSVLECKPLVRAVQSGFETRFEHLMDPCDTTGKSQPLFIAMMSNPQYKLNFMGLPTIPSNVLSNLKNMLFNAIAENQKVNFIEQEAIDVEHFENNETNVLKAVTRGKGLFWFFY